MFPTPGQLFVLSVLVSPLLSAPHVIPGETVRRSIHRTWYHPRDHPVHRLFRRDTATPGSPEWAAQYPKAVLPPISEETMPASWLAALHAAEQSGKIPNIPVSTSINGGNPTYGDQNPASPEICSSTSQCRGPDDIWDGPDGHVGIGFDDGPQEGSAKLYEFLDQQNLTATHFMIGVNILGGYALFNQAFSTLDNDIAVHTWTHPYMTTQNNTQVVAQLGWTMQIIHDSTGGRVPRYWRPPYGDSDNRVRAIAKEVFGITQVDWNRDSADWSIKTGQTTLPKVEESLKGWYAGPKSPGLIILEHELTNDTSGAFIDTFPTLVSSGWIPVSVVQLFDGTWQNADDNTGAVQSMDVGGPVPQSSSASASTSANATVTGSSSAAPSVSTSAGPNNNNNKDNTSGSMPVGDRVGLSTLLLIAGALALSVR